MSYSDLINGFQYISLIVTLVHERRDMRLECEVREVCNWFVRVVFQTCLCMTIHILRASFSYLHVLNVCLIKVGKFKILFLLPKIKILFER